jgi:hypothetical protein
VDQVSARREENVFTVTITTTRPADALCTQVLGSFERVIPLDVLDMPAGSYFVSVNGVTDSFELRVDNLSVTPEPTDDASAAIQGVVWHDTCGVAEGGEGEAVVNVSDGCVPALDGGFEANGVRDLDEPGLAGVLVTLGAGACPSSGEAEATTTAEGNYSFTGLTADTYCVTIDPQSGQNAPLLIPGSWTQPPGGENDVQVELERGQVRSNLNFGWDYQFLPTLNQEGCLDQAAFVRDLTAVDDTAFPPGATFTKTWRLRNTGTCTWGPEYYLIFFSGARMEGEAQPLPVVPPEGEVDLSVTLTAPAFDGTFRGDWLLQNAGRELFGIGEEVRQSFFVQAVVDSDLPQGALISGLVWDDRCVLLEDDSLGTGCAEGSEDSPRANGLFEEFEPRIAGIRVDLYDGECPASGEPLASQVTGRDGLYGFAGLAPGSYCVQVDESASENARELNAGGWTAPGAGEGRLTVTVGENETVTSNFFGWDYEIE